MIFTPKFWSKERNVSFLILLLGTLLVWFFIVAAGAEPSYGIDNTAEVDSTIILSVVVFGLIWLTVWGSSWWAVTHQKIEIAAGLDKESVREVLGYVNGLYPKIFIQTYAWRDPSEKLLAEYLPLVKKNSR